MSDVAPMRRRAWRRVAWAVFVAFLVLLNLDMALEARYPRVESDPIPYRCTHAARAVSGGERGLLRVGDRHQAVDPAPPSGLFRVLVVGSSAVFGPGFTEFQGFPWRLQRLLERRGLRAEVINMGRPALDSGDHLAALRVALPLLHPDLVVIYSGNNEFQRLRVYRHLHPEWTARAEQMRLQLEGVAVYRALVAWTGRAEGGQDTPLAVGPDDLKVAVTPGDSAVARTYYEGNLRRMVALCRASRTPVVLCTVLANELIPPRSGRCDDASVNETVEKAEALRERGDLEPARALVEAHLTRQPDDPWLHFERGRIAVSARDADTARRELSRAMESDPYPNRAPASFADVVRRVAADEGVALCDLEQRLREGADCGIPAQLFFDNCHFDLTGHEAVARTLDRFVAEQGLLPAASVSDPAAASTADLLDLEQSPVRYNEARRLLTDDPGPSIDPTGQTRSDLEKALGCALAPSDDPAGMTQRGHICYVLGRYNQAAVLYERAIDAGHRRAVAWRNLGHARLAADALEGALQAYEGFLKAGGTDAVVTARVALLRRVLAARGGAPMAGSPP